jgi:hypothetical protein
MPSDSGPASPHKNPKSTWAFEGRYPLFTRAALASAWFLGVLAAVQGIRQGVTLGNLGSDAHAYWLAAQGALSYTRSPGAGDAFLYSPAFAGAIRPLGLIPYEAFLPVWIGLETSALVWLLWPVRLRWSIPFFLLCIPELVVGNIYLLTAAAIVVAVTTPEMWAFPLLTKVTSGVGVLWFAFRGEWRSLARAAVATLFVAGASFYLAPGDWHNWLTFLAAHKDGSRDGSTGLAIRVVCAVILVAWGARNGRPWLIAPATVLAAPVYALMTLTLLVAIPRLDLHPTLDQPGVASVRTRRLISTSWLWRRRS